MKKLLLLLTVIFNSQFNLAQTWCAPGAEWHYRVYSTFMPYQDGYLKLTVATTNTIGGIQYNTLNMDYTGINNTPSSATVAVSYGNIYTYEQNNVVYASMNSSLSYDTIANFNANIGDKWRLTRRGTSSSFPNCPTVIPHVTVIDTGHVVINSQNLKTLILSPSNNLTYTYTMIQKIGSIDGFLFYHYTCLVDGWSLGGFTCYSDNNFPLYKKPGYNQACDYSLWSTVGMDEFNSQDSKFKVYPNPSNNSFTFEIENSNQIFTLKILDALGREIQEQKISNGSKVNIEDLAQGIYLLRVFSTENNLLFQTKLIKEN